MPKQTPIAADEAAENPVIDPAAEATAAQSTASPEEQFKAAESAAVDPDARVNVRLLSEYAGIKPGRVASVTATACAALCEQGIADDNPEAVAYALAENGTIVDID